MRFEKGHKERTRRHIVDVASRRFREDGAAASGLAGIMAEAGLTNGAFYPHFKSKDALFEEAVATALADQQARLEEDNAAAPGIERAIRAYLDTSHLAGRAEGCPSAALLPEIARQPAAARQSYTDGLSSYVATLASQLPDAGSPTAQQRARAIFGLMVGTLQLARAVPDRRSAEEILAGGIEAALKLAIE